MKKLLLIALSCFTLFACTKESNTSEPETQAEIKKYDVTFSMDGFSQGVAPMSAPTKSTLAAGDTLKNYVDNLYYNIYNSSGVLVNTVSQATNDPSFGTITDKLPAGTYNVLFLASKGNLALNQSSYSTAYFYPQNSGSMFNDTFAKRFLLTVGTSAITQQVRLDREISGLDVIIEDAIPVSASKISVIVQAEATLMYADGRSYSPINQKTVDYALVAADKGVKNKKFSTLIGNTYTATSIIVRAYDSTNGLIVEKTVPNVKFTKNQRTVLTGSLFPSSASSALGFTVAVNPSWNIPVTPIRF